MTTLESQVAQFNARCPIGAAVSYRSHRDAKPVQTRTRSEAWVLSGHTPVVMVEGFSGCVALSHVTEAAND